MRVVSLWALLIMIYLILRLVYISFGFGIPCLFHAVTGLFCPGCGMFRAVGALLEGNILQAARYNALCVVLLPLIVVLCIRETFRYIHRAAPVSVSRLEKSIYVGAVAISVIYAIARNLPAFAILKPTSI